MRCLLSCFSFGGLLERGQALVPERLEEREHLGQPLAPGAVQTAGAVAPFLDQAGGLENGEVLGDGRPGDREALGDGAGRELLAPDEAYDLAAARLGEGAKLSIHARMLADSFVSEN